VSIGQGPTKIADDKWKDFVFDNLYQRIWFAGGSKPMKSVDTKKYINTLNKETFCGINKWRLPNLIEGATLLSKRKVRQPEYMFANDLFFLICGQFWTSDKTNDGRIWTISLSSGTIGTSDPNSMIKVTAGS
jgi:hypothetical protein